MGMFGFSTRSLGRDRETDYSRFTRMQTTLGQVLAEIEREKAGLRKRFTDTSADAALTLEAMSGQNDTIAYESRLDDLTVSIQGYEQRIMFLDTQLEFVEGILGSIGSFIRDHRLMGSNS